MSPASFLLSEKFGIFGCGSRRTKATFSAVKSDLRAIAANGGTSALPASDHRQPRDRWRTSAWRNLYPKRRICCHLNGKCF